MGLTGRQEHKVRSSCEASRQCPRRNAGGTGRNVAKFFVLYLMEKRYLCRNRYISASSSILQEKSNILESSSLVHDSSQHVVVTRRATTPAASLTRVATPSLKSSIRKLSKARIFEQDQIEAALRCMIT